MPTFAPDILTAKKATFIEALGKYGTVKHAANAAGVSRQVTYVWRQVDAEFDRAWKDAVEDVADELERSLYQQAIDEKNITAHIVMLKALRPEKYRERTENINRNIEEERVAGRSREENMEVVRTNVLKLTGGRVQSQN